MIESFEVKEKCPIHEGMTISRSAKMESKNSITWFSMGRKTSITQESYDTEIIYIGAYGSGKIILGQETKKVELGKNDVVIVPAKMLCGMECDNAFVYTEILLEKEINMNKLVKAGEAFNLKKLISYEEGCITNLDVASNSTMKIVLMAFDEGCGLQPHRAPGNAIITALEGQAVIGYEGKDYELCEGESFRFDKDGLHSVTAKGRFKMSLVLVRDLEEK